MPRDRDWEPDKIEGFRHFLYLLAGYRPEAVARMSGHIEEDFPEIIEEILGFNPLVGGMSNAWLEDVAILVRAKKALHHPKVVERWPGVANHPIWATLEDRVVEAIQSDPNAWRFGRVAETRGDDHLPWSAIPDPSDDVSLPSVVERWLDGGLRSRMDAVFAERLRNDEQFLSAWRAEVHKRTAEITVYDVPGQPSRRVVDLGVGLVVRVSLDIPILRIDAPGLDHAELDAEHEHQIDWGNDLTGPQRTTIRVCWADLETWHDMAVREVLASQDEEARERLAWSVAFGEMRKAVEKACEKVASGMAGDAERRIASLAFQSLAALHATAGPHEPYPTRKFRSIANKTLREHSVLFDALPWDEHTQLLGYFDLDFDPWWIEVQEERVH